MAEKPEKYDFSFLQAIQPTTALILVFRYSESSPLHLCSVWSVADSAIHARVIMCIQIRLYANTLYSYNHIILQSASLEILHRFLVCQYYCLYVPVSFPVNLKWNVPRAAWTTSQ